MIAGIIDEIQIVEIINEKLGIKPQEKLSGGIIVKSIILNAIQLDRLFAGSFSVSKGFM
ncbi:MAG: DUF4277 domain-containing protein [Prochloraceae cyanobacterium]